MELRQVGDGYQLFVNGEPFWVRGVGGDACLETLKRMGGNAVRTWGAVDIDARLDRAHELGLKVAVGIWLEHPGGGRLQFDYNNPEHLAYQTEQVRRAVLRYRHHPAVLLWGIGNEMEVRQEGNPAVWRHINDLARMVKELDPNRPTMTVTAELGGPRVAMVNRYLPDIDIHGINSYGGMPTLARRYRELGGVKPFLITEFGPLGPWEVGRTPWGAPIDVSSTEKANFYRLAWESSILPEKGRLGLGSFAFLWGDKEEATATWFGMKLPDGSRLAAADVMSELWTGNPVPDPVPVLRSMTVDRNQVGPGETIRAVLDVYDPRGRPLRAEWVLTEDPQQYLTMGAFREPAPVVRDAILRGDLHGAEIRMPAKIGPYWLYAHVRNDTGGAATMVVPLNVLPQAAPGAQAAPGQAGPGREPVIVFGDDLRGAPPFAWTGFMGTMEAIEIDENWTENPRSGATSMRVRFGASSGWGAVAAQHPPNNWGEMPEAVDLTGATRLTFWARGDRGGEVVTFRMGILGADRPHRDSASAELAMVRLTSQWQQYSIDLRGKDLSRIKTGFVWAVEARGGPVTFYLDDIRYE